KKTLRFLSLSLAAPCSRRWAALSCGLLLLGGQRLDEPPALVDVDERLRVPVGGDQPAVADRVVHLRHAHASSRRELLDGVGEGLLLDLLLAHAVCSLKNSVGCTPKRPLTRSSVSSPTLVGSADTVRARSAASGLS